jgi:hypothetical protein
MDGKDLILLFSADQITFWGIVIPFIGEWMDGMGEEGCS